MEGKTSIVTGANTGLGWATSRALAAKGGTVVMVCRSEEKGRAAREELIRSTGKEAVHLVVADLASQAEIHRAADEIKERWPRIDVLVNNAATIHSERKVTAEGLEMQLAVNHLAPFLLTHLLLPALLAAPQGRVVNVGSNNHFRARIHFEDLQLSDNYQVLRAYGQSKLANLLFTYELDRRRRRLGFKQLTVNCADPGLNDTAIGNKGTNFLQSLAWRLRRLQAQSPSKGAATQIHLASASGLSETSGQYWVNGQPRKSSGLSYDEETARRLWEHSEELCGITDYFGKS